MLPLVTCIVPTYNRHDMLKKSIQLFVRQTYPNLEIIIVDDSDTSCPFTFPENVRYIRLRARRSIGYKRNLAVQYAKGELIAFWDDDDYHGPKRIEHQVRHLQQTKADVVADGNHVYKYNSMYYTLEDTEMQEHLWWKRILMPSVLFRKSLMKYASFPNRYTSEDREFFKRILKKQNINIRLLKSRSVDFVYNIHNMNNPWSVYMAHIISVTKPYAKHCLCVK